MGAIPSRIERLAGIGMVRDSIQSVWREETAMVRDCTPSGLLAAIGTEQGCILSGCNERRIYDAIAAVRGELTEVGISRANAQLWQVFGRYTDDLRDNPAGLAQRMREKAAEIAGA
jgi:hypothetical protein